MNSPDDKPRSPQDDTRAAPQSGRPQDESAPRQAPDPAAGLDREVGDLEDPEAEEDGALPGRVGGGLAGG